jgi:hypothetical protein
MGNPREAPHGWLMNMNVMGGKIYPVCYTRLLEAARMFF